MNDLRHSTCYALTHRSRGDYLELQKSVDTLDCINDLKKTSRTLIHRNKLSQLTFGKAACFLTGKNIIRINTLLTNYLRNQILFPVSIMKKQ